MARITFQVVEGLEAGRVFAEIATPLTVGREEDNDIQLNDERVSRFHAKVQDDGGRLILTDLDSTNGTRVNGHPVRMRVLRRGDLIMIGRCVLLVGGPDELPKLEARLHTLAAAENVDENDTPPTDIQPSDLADAFPDGPPHPPAELTPLQTAEVSDLLEFIRTELLAVISQPVEELNVDGVESLRIQRNAWEMLQALAPEISRMQTQLLNRPNE